MEDKTMNKESNVYTILFAAVMIIIITLSLSFLHQTLRPLQLENERVDKMRQILRSLNIEKSAAEAEAEFNRLITNSYMITPEGSRVAGTERAPGNDPAFAAVLRNDIVGLPVFEATIDGNTVYIFPMRGAGMWGPIWGYLAVNADGNTIFGAAFDHSAETPGLGDAIATRPFAERYIGKQLFRNDNFMSIAVVRPGTSALNRDYVDGISGGTITSRAVGYMMYESISQYERFLRSLQSGR
jgi:Na+-transporting NADH:ubiquinone oxidoreductase subunit C